jgi:hypothetical protein
MSQVWAVTFKSTWNTVLLENVLHFETSPTDNFGLGGASINDLLNAIDTKFTTPYRAMLNSGSTFTSITAREEVLPGSGDVPGEGTKSIGLAGTRTASDQHISPAMCAVVEKKTSAAIKAGNGRLWTPPVLNSGECTNNSQYSTGTAYWTAVVAFAALLDDTLTAGSFPGFGADVKPVVYSKTRRVRSQSPYTFQITAGVPINRQRWLRSREV